MALSSSRIVLAVICLLSSFSTTSQALIFDGLPISGVQIGGVLTCDDRSIAVAKTFNVIPNAPVDLGPLRLLTAVATDQVSGAYLFVLTLLDTLLFDQTKCFLRFTIPENTCTFPLPNMVLRAPVQPINVVQIMTGNLLIMVAGPLTYLG